MSLLPSIFQGMGGLLKSPGDSMTAKITKMGKQVVKLATKETKQTIVRYPSTGKTVVTTVLEDIAKGK